MGRKSPYSNSVKNRRNSYNNSVNKKRKTFVKENKSLENTTRIRVDKERLNDYESLDTSFLEGRRQKPKIKDINYDKKNIETSRFNVSILKTFRNIFYFLGVFSLIVLVFLILYNNFLRKNNDTAKENNVKHSEKVDEAFTIDTNYLFVGGFYTIDFPLEELDFSFPYVKNSKEKMLVGDLLNSMKSNIYDYNPSDVFLELGTDDFLDGKDESEILEDIENIIKEIKENRPYAKIYVESFYPINKDLDGYDDLFEGKDNESIIEFNKKLKQLCKYSNVHYIDVFSELSEDGKLKQEYTDDGVKLNKEGYKRLLKVIQIVADNN